MGWEFQYLDGKAENSYIYKNKARIPVFEKKDQIPLFGRISSEFQCW